jgi:hypothetical protein
MLDKGWLGVLANGVRSLEGSRGVRVLSSVRVLGRGGNDRGSGSRRSSVRMLDGLVGVVGVVGGFDRLDAVVGHVVCLEWRCGFG